MRCLALTALLFAGSASAQSIALKPLLDLRVRYENVDQDDLSEAASALTTRIRPGVTVASGPWSALIEGEATAALIDRYNSGTNEKLQYPLVVDPENFELNRVQIRYANSKGVTATVGRQLLELADQRFVGSSNFRQNQQTFDAARVQAGKAKGLFADVTYSWSAQTVNGTKGRGPRQQAVSGDNVFALAGFRSDHATLTAFAYLVDQNELLVQNYRLSSQTYGMRLSGSVPLRGGGKLSYVASAAKQSDYHRNPNDYSAGYWQGELTFASAPFTIGAGYEVLGADKGASLTSVQTPLASLFKFNGWADKFTTTPPDGLRDLYASAGYGWKAIGPADAVDLSIIYHRFDADRIGIDYGEEWDMLASAKLRGVTLSARYAHYETKGFATDTEKLWLELSWIL
jgi:hypothetical protein